jgi:ammonium transporter
MRPDAVQEVWLLVATCLVFFMQAGFLCLEAGSVRKRNAVNVAMKNFIVELVSTIAFASVGFALMFGVSQSGWIGWAPPMLKGLQGHELLVFLFQAVFCGTAATIVSGAVAERLRFLPFVMESALLCAFLYPLFGHWVWGGGWLAGLGFKDFAGSSVVHLMGAGVAFAGVVTLGPRHGRFKSDGTAVPIPPSDLVLSSLGTFILVFGWFGFNGGSAPFGEITGVIVVNTLLAGCFGGVTAMLSSWALRGVSDIGLVLNGTLGGLVAITASADIVPVQAAPAIGILAGLVVHGATVLLEKARLDDAVGALPVHGACGILGILAVPVFATEAAVNGQFLANPENATRLHWFFVQSTGVLACLAVSIGGGFAVWKLVGTTTRLRVTLDGEQTGMNYSEHRISDPTSQAMSAISLSMASSIDIDPLRGTDFEPLAVAVNRMMAAVKTREAEGARWRAEVESVGQRLDRTSRSVRATRAGLAEGFSDLGRKLTDLSVFARSQQGTGPEAASMRMVGDLLGQLNQSLDGALKEDRKLADLWDDVEEAARRLGVVSKALGDGARRGGSDA